MGLNAYFAFVVVLGYGLKLATGPDGCFYLFNCVFPVFHHPHTQLADPVYSSRNANCHHRGDWPFLAMIGLQGAGLIIDNPDTLVGLGRLDDPQTLLALTGLILMAALDKLGIRGSILITILGLSAVGWFTGLASFNGLTSMPPMASAAFSLDFSALTTTAFLSVVFVMFFVDFFDTTGTLTAIAEPAGLKDKNGKIKNLDKAVLADTSASIFGSLLGTSNMTTYLGKCGWFAKRWAHWLCCGHCGSSVRSLPIFLNRYSRLFRDLRRPLPLSMLLSAFLVDCGKLTGQICRSPCPLY